MHFRFITLFLLLCFSGLPGACTRTTDFIEERLGGPAGPGLMAAQRFVCAFSGMDYSNAAALRTLVETHVPGGIIFRSRDNIRDRDSFINLTGEINNAIRLIPPFLCLDEEGGRVHQLTREKGFPVSNYSPRRLGAISNPSFTRKYYQELTREIKRTGCNVSFAPVVDCNTYPDNPIIGAKGRSYGEEPALVITHAHAYISAAEKNNVMSCIKHFPGHGSSRKDSHRHPVDITATFDTRELIPFKALLPRSPAIMVGHLVHREVDTHPASLSRTWIHDILRTEWGYEGLVITDDIAMKAVSSVYRFDEAVRRAVHAGCDLIIVDTPQQARRGTEIILTMHREGTLTTEELRESFLRITSAKRRYCSWRPLLQEAVTHSEGRYGGSK